MQRQRQQRGSCGMAGWVRLRGTLQVRPCKLGRAIHGAHAPATGPTPPSTDLRNLSGWHDLLLVGVDLGRHVDPRHAWMSFVQLSKYSISISISIEMDPPSPGICRRWGGVGLRGVSRMDAAAKPTRTYLRRPRNPTPPRLPLTASCCCCFGLCGCRAPPGRTPVTSTVARSCPAAVHAHPCAG